MLVPHIVEMNELAAPQLCQYIASKHYVPIRHSLKTMEEYLHEVEAEHSTSGQEDLVMLLFYKLKDELEQMLRNDTIIVFPLIRREIGHNYHTDMPLPTAMIHQMHKKILKLLDKLRTQVNSYLVKPEWTESFKLFCDELFTLDQQVQQAIYIKENVLLKKAQSAASTNSIHD